MLSVAPAQAPGVLAKEYGWAWVVECYFLYLSCIRGTSLLRVP